MNSLNDHVVDCQGFNLLKSLAWDKKQTKHNINDTETLSDWGFLICSPSDTIDKKNVGENFFGAMGQIKNPLQESCLGVTLNSAQDAETALSWLTLACGMSILEKANANFGDSIILAGVNSLAISIMQASKIQGLRSACLRDQSAIEGDYDTTVDKLADVSLTFDYSKTCDTQLEQFCNNSLGKTILIDTTGLPELAYTLAEKVNKFGSLIFCRQDAITTLNLKIRELHHIKSAHYIYWSRPETLMEGLYLKSLCIRAKMLLAFKRTDKSFIVQEHNIL